MLKQIKHIIIIVFGLIYFQSQAQIQVNKQYITIQFDDKSKGILVDQKLNITNKSSSAVDTIYFYAWANAYSTKKTPLAKRFIENYDLNYHFTRKKNRGFIKINTINATQDTLVAYDFLTKKPDILRLVFPDKIRANTTIDIHFNYFIKLPNSKFTGFGIDKKNNIFLEHFYFTPSDYNKLYSNKGLDDWVESPTDFVVELKNFDQNKNVLSNLESKNNILYGNNISNLKISIYQFGYERLASDNLSVDIYKTKPGVSKIERLKRLNKILRFIEKNLGKYPYKKIIISKSDFSRNKIYGLDLLPKFINPFPNELVWEMKILHQLSIKFAHSMQVDKRRYPWIVQGLSAYIEYMYLKEYYPDLKLIGSLSNFKLVRFYYASQVKMTEKYPWLYLYMARMNKDQKLSTALDSLSNFNRSVANPNKAALGLLMLQDQMGAITFSNKMHKFYQKSLKTPVNDREFFRLFAIEEKYPWFEKYIYTRTKYDYKIKKEKESADSLYYKIIQKQNASIPSKIYGIRNDTIVWEKQLPPITNDTIVATPKKMDMVGLNYYNDYPELQTNNNFVNNKSFLGLGKPIQIRLYQDFDNPKKQQIFVNPYFEYNYYDGVQIGGQLMNESILHNHFNYLITPVYGTKSKVLTGSMNVSYSKYFENLKPYALLFGMSAKYFHYDHNLTYTRINPYFVIKHRSKYLRERQGSNLLFQYMSIDKEVNSVKTAADKYDVFNVSYKYFNVNIIKDFFAKSDLQISKNFGKVSGMLRYRLLTDKNRQWDFRIFAGYFLYNNTQTDYFSFALDRPTDYLFQYNYYGRSESTGIFHQQFVWAEGGFKTFFDDQYANSFIFSQNINIGIWKWFNLYGDWAIKKNKGEKAEFYYDSGVRINLVQDYFEAFFPIYSSLGNELKQPAYHQKIRLVFTINLQHMFDMVKRGWY